MATISKRGDYQFQAIIRRKGYPAQTKTFECVFQPSWTVIPREAGHAFQSKLDSRRVATRGCWGFTRVMSLGSSCRASA